MRCHVVEDLLPMEIHQQKHTCDVQLGDQITFLAAYREVALLNIPQRFYDSNLPPILAEVVLQRLYDEMGRHRKQLVETLYDAIVVAHETTSESQIVELDG